MDLVSIDPNWREHYEVYRQIGSFFMCMITCVFLGGHVLTNVGKLI